MSTTRSTTRRTRTELDRSVDRQAARRRRETMLRRNVYAAVSEVDVLIWLFGILSILYCSVAIVVEVLRMLSQ